MKIMGMGLDYSGNALFTSIDEGLFAKAIRDALERNGEVVQALDQITKTAITFRSEIEREIVDTGDPRAAGWTFLIYSNDPQRADIETILEPLAKHRGMHNPDQPLFYNGESEDEWFDWLNDNYFALELEGDKIPQYILIVGNPNQIPFHFQSILASVANVGRVDFDLLDDLKQYVDKIIRCENADEPLVSPEAILFAPDHGFNEKGELDPTYFSRKYMVEPLATYIKDEIGLEVHPIIGDEATKKNLLNALLDKKPALVYTASHGLGAIDEPYELQKRFNGAICCQHDGPLTLDALLSADDILFDQPFLEGSIFFQFACFGYGTPAQSDFAHWLDNVPKQYTEADFVAALPKKLLAHPRGPIAYIGHLDTAFLHGFADVESSHILDRWHSRIEPFVKAVNQLLKVQPSGLAMQGMSKRYGTCNAQITNTYVRQRRGKLKWSSDLEVRLLNTWITRGDAQNYMIFGDPAVRLRIPTK